MKKFLLILLPAMSLLGACKKNTNDVNAPAPVPGGTSAKVKTKTSASITTFTYDASGRQLKSINSNGSGYEYEYLPGIINIKSLGAGGVYQYTEKYELNADAFCTRRTSSNNPNFEDLFLYNADKTEAKNIIHSNGSTMVFDYFYSNGNNDSMRIIGINGSWAYTVIKTYYTDKPNVLSHVNTGENFFGKVNKNMLKSEVYKYPDGSTNIPIDFSYEYDAQGRVIKETSSKGNNISISLFTYY